MPNQSEIEAQLHANKRSGIALKSPRFEFYKRDGPNTSEALAQQDMDWVQSVIDSPGRGPILEGDANTVAHVWFDKGALQDTKGNAWTQAGQVPVSTGFVDMAGPFSNVNRFDLSDNTLRMPDAPFTIVVIWMRSAALATESIAKAGIGFGGNGWQISQENGNTRFMTFNAGAGSSALSSGCTAGVNVTCGGYNGGIAYVKANLAPLQGGSSSAMIQATSGGSIGPPGSGRLAFAGRLLEFWVSTTTPSEANFIAYATRVKQVLSVTAW